MMKYTMHSISSLPVLLTRWRLCLWGVQYDCSMYKLHWQYKWSELWAMSAYLPSQQHSHDVWPFILHTWVINSLCMSTHSAHTWYCCPTACRCDVAGTMSQVCDTGGQCTCKSAVDSTTLKCSECRDGYWNLSSANPLGCTGLFPTT